MSSCINVIIEQLLLLLFNPRRLAVVVEEALVEASPGGDGQDMAMI